MVLRIKLGDYRPAPQPDPLGRSYIGYFPRMTEREAWEAARGAWKLSDRKVRRERFVLVVGHGHVRAVAEISAVIAHDDRKELRGDLLGPGHPLYDRYITLDDPLANDSQNSVTYGELPEEAGARTRPCGCGCEQVTERDFVPGHEIRAVQARVRTHFGGNVASFLAWLDTALPPGQPARRAI